MKAIRINDMHELNCQKYISLLQNKTSLTHTVTKYKETNRYFEITSHVYL